MRLPRLQSLARRAGAYRPLSLARRLRRQCCRPGRGFVARNRRKGADFWDHEGDWKFLANRFKDWSPEAHEVSAPAICGCAGPCSTARRFPHGRAAASRCSATRPIPCCPISRRERLRRLRTARRWPTALRARRKIPPGACKLFRGAHGPRQPHSGRLARSRHDLPHGRPQAFARDMVLRASGSRRLLSRQDWIYSA